MLTVPRDLALGNTPLSTTILVVSRGRPSRASQLAVQRSPVAIASAGTEPIPLYFQIVNVLESRILSGQCAAGSLLGTEKDFAAEFGVSRITITRALDALESKGLITRKRRLGTFVAYGVRRVGGSSCTARWMRSS